MGKSWTAAMPVVIVPRQETPKALTLVLPYYDNPRFLARQAAHWGGYPASLRGHLSIIVVDDGSPEPARLPDWLPIEMRLFRIEQDVRWNWLAARNIGARHAADGWMLLTDMDHVVPVETLDALIHGQHDPGVIYAFSRREHTGEALSPHPNSWFLTREMFWRVGGYDETLSGHYGTDGDWRRRCAATAPMQVLADTLVRHEFVEDASTTRYLRKQPEDAAVKQLVSQRGKHWRPKTLSFPYHEVTL